MRTERGGRSKAHSLITFVGVSDPVEERRGQVPLCQPSLSLYPATERQSPVTCRCVAGNFGFDGAVYGSGPYTADSNICTAARHAGALASDDGIVTVTPSPGLDAYPGSTRNGVISTNWRRHPSSMNVVAGPD